jgi:Carboxypeptidase regulatory-like domain
MHASSSCGRSDSHYTFLILLVLATLSLIPDLLAEAYFGTVSGELTDATGAVVVGAKVVLTGQLMGFTFQAIPDAAGHYLFQSVPHELYSVASESVDGENFGKITQTSVGLREMQLGLKFNF